MHMKHFGEYSRLVWFFRDLCHFRSAYVIIQDVLAYAFNGEYCFFCIPYMMLLMD